MPTKAEALYPYLGINGDYLSKDFLDSVWRHLDAMAPIWASRIDVPSPTDRLAYLVVKQITHRRPGLNEMRLKDRVADKCGGTECPQGKPCSCRTWAEERS